MIGTTKTAVDNSLAMPQPRTWHEGWLFDFVTIIWVKPFKATPTLTLCPGEGCRLPPSLECQGLNRTNLNHSSQPLGLFPISNADEDLLALKLASSNH
jgi:hypothetical protein